MEECTGNIAILRVAEGITAIGEGAFQEGNLLIPFKGRFKNKRFDMIISNPPYIKTSVIPTLQREVRDHEPMMALDGGAGGLDFYSRIIADAADCLKKDGVLMFEIGHDQREAVCGLIEETEKFVNVTCLQDLGNRKTGISAGRGGFAGDI